MIILSQEVCLACAGTKGEDCSVCEGFGHVLVEDSQVYVHIDQLDLFPQDIC